MADTDFVIAILGRQNHFENIRVGRMLGDSGCEQLALSNLVKATDARA